MLIPYQPSIRQERFQIHHLELSSSLLLGSLPSLTPHLLPHLLRLRHKLRITHHRSALGDLIA